MKFEQFLKERGYSRASWKKRTPCFYDRIWQRGHWPWEIGINTVRGEGWLVVGVVKQPRYSTLNIGCLLTEDVMKALPYVEQQMWALAGACTDCGSMDVRREDYLNPCASAACQLNGPVTYHLGCGSQYKEYCAGCNALLFDSVDDEIANVEWEEVGYICSQCEVDGIQPGHFACGTTYYIPK